MNEQKTYILKRDGIKIFIGTNNECHKYLQKTQSQSADWAKKYEGYSVEVATEEEIKKELEK